MNPTLRQTAPAGFATGDRTGLRKVGRPAGFLDASWVTDDMT